ncbi:MAG: hypothetical protein KC486_35585 [Myxococcales bacterium]|nr:hypothetical protein [Myxococcales bacterium]
MREDMHKVIVERPRCGGSYGPQGGRARMRVRLDPESAPTQGRMRERRTKALNENLAPLRRYIEAQAGRPWDKVYSEIRQRIRATSAVQLHVLQHIDDIVARHVDLVDGVPWTRTGYGGAVPLRPRRLRRLYVCPRTGLVRRIPEPPKPKPPLRAEDRVDVDPSLSYCRIDGEWVGVEFAAVPESWPALERSYDVLLGRTLASLRSLWHIERELRRFYGDAGRYAVRTRRLGKRELRRIARETVKTGERGAKRRRR